MESVTQCYKAFLCTYIQHVPVKHTDACVINLCLPFNNGVAKDETVLRTLIYSQHKMLRHLFQMLLCIDQSMPSIKPCSVSIILNRSVTECYKAFLCTCIHQVPAKHTDTHFINLCLPFNNGVAK
jgi:hypothetical protein